MIRLYLLGFKGLKVLQELDESSLKHIKDVVVATDKSIQNDYSDEILAVCEERQLRSSLRGSEPKIAEHHSIAIGWRWLITNTENLIVIHDSMLPRLRGFNPLVTSLINGDEEIGATALFGSKEFDKGEIIDQESIKISYPMKINDAILKVADLYAKLVNRIVGCLGENRQLQSQEQNESEATYSLWRDDLDYRIDWTKSAIEIERFINAVGHPYNGAYAFLNGSKIRIHDAEAQLDVKIENRTSGKVLFKDNEGLTIVCGNGLLKIKSVLNEDGKSINLKSKFRLRFE